MASSQALYYPTIDIHNESWLKSAFLYWDSIRTIVPESIELPYASNTAQALQDEGFLVPLRVNPQMDEIEELTAQVLGYLNTSEGAELLLSDDGRRQHRIHVDKLPYRFQRLSHIHPEKLPREIRHMFSRSKTESDWLEVGESFALYYMTLLATQLAERIGAGLLTPIPMAERLAVAARLDAQLQEIVPRELHGHSHWREYEAFGPRRQIPRTLVPGILSQVAIQGIAINPDTPIEDLLAFKRNHKDELALFRNKIEELASTVDTDLPAEALRQRIVEIHEHEVMPALTDLRRALEGRRIKWLSDSLLKIAFLSATSTSMLVTAGLAAPTALLAGAGISLVASSTMYNADKGEALRSNPYTYLLSAEKEL